MFSPSQFPAVSSSSHKAHSHPPSLSSFPLPIFVVASAGLSSLLGRRERRLRRNRNRLRQTPSTSDTAIGTSGTGDALGTYPVTVQTTQVETTGGVLRVAIYSPRIENDLRPALQPPLDPGTAVIFIHGAGSADFRRFEPNKEATHTCNLAFQRLFS